MYSQQAYRADAVTIPILQMRTPRLRHEVITLSVRQWGWNLKLECPAPESGTLTPPHCCASPEASPAHISLHSPLLLLLPFNLIAAMHHHRHNPTFSTSPFGLGQIIAPDTGPTPPRHHTALSLHLPHHFSCHLQRDQLTLSTTFSTYKILNCK